MDAPEVLNKVIENFQRNFNLLREIVSELNKEKTSASVWFTLLAGFSLFNLKEFLSSLIQEEITGIPLLIAAVPFILSVFGGVFGRYFAHKVLRIDADYYLLKVAETSLLPFKEKDPSERFNRFLELVSDEHEVVKKLKEKVDKKTPVANRFDALNFWSLGIGIIWAPVFALGYRYFILSC